MIQTSRLFTVIEMKVCSKCLQVLVCCSVSVARHLRVSPYQFLMSDISLISPSVSTFPPLIFSWNFSIMVNSDQDCPQSHFDLPPGDVQRYKNNTILLQNFYPQQFPLTKRKIFYSFLQMVWAKQTSERRRERDRRIK